jgi:DUF1365 family protein
VTTQLQGPRALAPKDARASNSAIYEGWIRHRRHDPVEHEFRYPLFMAYLDLAEIPWVYDPYPGWSARRPALARFKRSDYLGPADRPLADCVREAVVERGGGEPRGPIRLLTNLRYFGHTFNPVSFYYCFDRRERLMAVLAEITNTPWGERHHYVLAADERGRITARFGKAFHVSPFQPIDHDYVWRFSAPGQRLAVHMENHAANGKAFDATLVMKRRPWRTSTLLRAWLRQPWLSLGVTTSIYWHALRLWLRRAPFHPHPARRAHT